MHLGGRRGQACWRTMLNTRNLKMIADQNGNDFCNKSCRFGYFSGPSYREAHSGWRAAWLGGWGRPAGHMGCMLFIQVGVAHKRFRAARLAQSAPWRSPWPSMLEDNAQYQTSPKRSLTKMVSILLPNRTDSDTFPAHPTGRHILAGRLLGWADGEGQLGTLGACCLFK